MPLPSNGTSALRATAPSATKLKGWCCTVTTSPGRRRTFWRGSLITCPSGITARRSPRASWTVDCSIGCLLPPATAKASSSRSPRADRPICRLAPTSPRMVAVRVSFCTSRTTACGSLARRRRRPTIRDSTCSGRMPCTRIRPTKGISTIPSSSTCWRGSGVLAATSLFPPNCRSPGTAPNSTAGGASQIAMST